MGGKVAGAKNNPIKDFSERSITLLHFRVAIKPSCLRNDYSLMDSKWILNIISARG